MFDSGLKSEFSLSHRNFTQSIVHFMCEYRVWTKNDDELVQMFFFKNYGVSNVYRKIISK